MLATYPQYSPQPLVATPFGATLFAPPGLHAGNSFFGHEPGIAGFVQPGFVQPSFVQPGFVQPTPFAPTYATTAGYPFPQTPYSPYVVAQQLVLALGQLAQQISVQTVVGQQIGAALQQLTQQVQAQSLLPGMAGFGIAQPYGSIGSPFIGATPGIQPAWQAWGGPRTQTIQ